MCLRSWSASAVVSKKSIPCAPVAQLDRASDYGSEGWGFEFLQAHSRKHQRAASTPTERLGFFASVSERSAHPTRSSRDRESAASGARPAVAISCAYAAATGCGERSSAWSPMRSSSPRLTRRSCCQSTESMSGNQVKPRTGMLTAIELLHLAPLLGEPVDRERAVAARLGDEERQDRSARGSRRQAPRGRRAALPSQCFHPRTPYAPTSRSSRRRASGVQPRAARGGMRSRPWSSPTRRAGLRFAEPVCDPT